MKALIAGAGGQVGYEVGRAAWPTEWNLLLCDRAALDISRQDSIDVVIERERPDLVVNLAAYTAVDRAETDSEAAWAANAVGPEYFATACARFGVPLIHLSTDYVFDGEKDAPYREDDAVGPLGVYGASKEAGERAVRALDEHVILRTAWVYGVHGSNFVKTMLRLGAERPMLRVVADQHGCPTAAADIAAAIVALAAKIAAGGARWGTYHFSGTGVTTWHGFAEAIFAAGGGEGRPVPRVEPIATADYPTPAKRPRNSVLDCRKIADAFGIVAPPWQQSLARMLTGLSERDGKA